MANRRVVLAMSGGVDSSVAAHLLVESGYEVIGLFMRTGASEAPSACGDTPQPARKTRGCCSAIDADDARRVADRLDIPFYALNFSDEFTRIQDYFVDEYLSGRTPNPCVVCNTWLKFGKLWEYAQSVGAASIATGHYARVLRDESGAASLHAAVDDTKDQSYFLFGVRPEMIERMLFPIGDFRKTDVRIVAESLDLPVASKPDSQEICFVPSGNYQDFIRKHRPRLAEEPGHIIDADGKVLATHSGISNYTIGQRKGLGVAVGEPRFVVEIQPQTRNVVVGPRELLAQRKLHVRDVNWLTPGSIDVIRCETKIRYLHRPASAIVHKLPDNRARVDFDEPQTAVTPGQAAVFYRDSQVLGGGWIE